MMENARVTALTVSELLRKNQQGEGGGVKLSPRPPRLGLRKFKVLSFKGMLLDYMFYIFNKAILSSEGLYVFQHFTVALKSQTF